MADQVIVLPEYFSPIMAEEFANQQNLLNPMNRIVSLGTNQEITKGGEIFTWRINEPIGDNYEDIVSQNTTLTPDVLDQKEMKGISIPIGKTYKESKYNQTLTGQDTLNANLVKGFATWTVGGVQKKLAKSVLGAFKAASATPFIYDITGIGNGNIIDTTLIDIIAVKTPNKNEGYFNTLVVHASVFADLKKSKLLTYNNTLLGSEMSQKIGMPDINGIKVIANSQMCAPTDGVYPSYLCADGAFIVDYQRDPIIYKEFFAKVGGGTEEITFYETIFATVMGASWIGAGGVKPTDANLLTGTNWEWIYFDAENAKCIQILSTLTA